jgi:hypothetical protein
MSEAERNELAGPSGSVCFTHYSAHCFPPWMAIHRESALELLNGYNLTEQEKTDVGHIMAGYCCLLDDAGLIHYGATQDEAVAKACGLIPPNTDSQT